MKLILITGTSLAQGQAKEFGKLSSKYRDSCAVCEMDEVDMKTLGVEPAQNVRVKSKHGTVVLRAAKAREPRPGVVFIPAGPWANVLIGTETHGTGMPLFKGVEVEVESSLSEKVLDLKELMEKTYGK